MEELRRICLICHGDILIFFLGSPNHAPIFTEIMEELRRICLICHGDILIFDKGYLQS